jgi:hypothetical protein
LQWAGFFIIEVTWNTVVIHIVNRKIRPPHKIEGLPRRLAMLLKPRLHYAQFLVRHG